MLEHISSDDVDNLKKKEVEVQEETMQMVRIFHDFHIKVIIIEVSN